MNESTNKEIKTEQWKVSKVYDKCKRGKIRNGKYQRKSKWLYLPNPKKQKIPSVQKFIDMLFEKKHGQHTITLGFEEDSSLQNYENVDGNNRMKALVLFLDSPFKIYPKKYQLIEDVFDSNRNAKVLKHYNELTEFFYGLSYEQIYRYDDWFGFFNMYDKKHLYNALKDSVIQEKLHPLLREIRNSFRVDGGDFRKEVTMLFNIYEGYTQSELCTTFYELNAYNHSMTKIEILSAYLCEVYITIDNNIRRAELYNQCKQYYGDKTENEELSCYQIEEENEWNPNVFEILVSLQNLLSQDYKGYIEKISSLKNGDLPVLFRLYSSIYGDLFELKNYTNNNIETFIDLLNKTYYELKALFDKMTRAAIESKQLNKMTGETLFKKLNGNKRFLVLSLIARGIKNETLNNIKLKIQKFVLYEFFCSSITNKNKEDKKIFLSYSPLTQPGGGALIDNLSKKYLNTPNNIDDGITKEIFSKVIDLLYQENIQKKTHMEKAKTNKRRKRKPYERILFHYYYMIKAPQHYINTHKFSDEHIIPFSSSWDGDLDIDRFGNIYPIIHTVNLKRGNKHINNYRNCNKPMYEYLLHMKNLIPSDETYNGIIEYVENKPIFKNNRQAVDSYDGLCERNEQEYKTNFLDIIF